MSTNSRIGDVASASAAERSQRSVFVGNIPYEATEEELKELFSQVGPIVGFRLVFDRETGKSKGYGFCEFLDEETALSALRNLNRFEFHGRYLRVDTAAGDRSKEELRQLQMSFGLPADETKTYSEIIAEMNECFSYELSKLLDCQVCYRKLESPKHLWCGHALCLQCFERLLRPDNYIKCPMCRQLSKKDRLNHPLSSYPLQDFVQLYNKDMDARKFLKCIEPLLGNSSQAELEDRKLAVQKWRESVSASLDNIYKNCEDLECDSIQLELLRLSYISKHVEIGENGGDSDFSLPVDKESEYSYLQNSLLEMKKEFDDFHARLLTALQQNNEAFLLSAEVEFQGELASLKDAMDNLYKKQSVLFERQKIFMDSFIRLDKG